MSVVRCEFTRINIKKLMEMEASDFAKKPIDNIEEKLIGTIDFIEFSSIKSSDEAHNELKKQIFLQIYSRVIYEGKNSFDTSEFEFLYSEIYYFIRRCDRNIMIKFFKEKSFNLSQCDDKHQYPIISW